MLEKKRTFKNKSIWNDKINQKRKTWKGKGVLYKLGQLYAHLFHFSENAPVLVFSLVPDIFLAYKCYHELLLVATVVQKMDPLGRKQGSWAAVPPCWGIAKQGFSFIHPVFLSLRFCSSTAYYGRKQNGTRYSYNIKEKTKQKNLRIHSSTSFLLPVSATISLFSAEHFNFGLKDTFPLKEVYLTRYQKKLNNSCFMGKVDSRHLDISGQSSLGILANLLLKFLE